jgi:hypothetical protein
MNPAGEYLWGFGCVAHLYIVSELDSFGAKARSSRLCLRPSLKAGVITGTGRHIESCGLLSFKGYTEPTDRH